MQRELKRLFLLNLCGHQAKSLSDSTRLFTGTRNVRRNADKLREVMHNFTVLNRMSLKCNKKKAGG